MTSKYLEHIRFTLFVLLVMSSFFTIVHGIDLLVDEKSHYFQIFLFSMGRYDTSVGITVLPGYHHLMALLARVAHLWTPDFFRICTFMISLATILVFFLLTKALSAGHRYAKTTQFMFLPILFPFFFLIYTDVLSLFLVLLSICLVENRKFAFAGAAGIAAIAVRQNNIVWLGLLFLIVLSEHGFHRPDSKALRSLLHDTWVLLAGLALFVIFLVWNNGPAFGDKMAHPAFSFHSGNIIFCLITLGIFFLPQHVANFERIVSLARNHSARFVFISTLVFLLYWFSFSVSHRYNQPDFSFFIRNHIVNHITETSVRKALYFLPIYYALLSVAVTPLYKKTYYWIYPLSAFYLSASWLIEPRYSIIPCALYLLMKKPQRAWIEWTTAIYLFSITAFVFLGTVNQQFFL